MRVGLKPNPLLAMNSPKYKSHGGGGEGASFGESYEKANIQDSCLPI